MRHILGLTTMLNVGNHTEHGSKRPFLKGVQYFYKRNMYGDFFPLFHL